MYDKSLYVSGELDCESALTFSIACWDPEQDPGVPGVPIGDIGLGGHHGSPTAGSPPPNSER